MKLIKNILFIIFALNVVSAYGSDRLAQLRSARKIVTENSISAPYYTIQIVALKEPPGNAEFFRNVDVVREFVCTDGFVRYSVGEYSSFADAARNLESIKGLGYQDAFVLNLRHITLTNNQYQPVQSTFTPDAGTEYTIQLAAYRFPVYVSEFSEFDNIQEYYMQDRIYRYTVGRYRGDVALQELERVKRMGYPDAFLVRLDQLEPYRIE